jgi:hypothetical protein
MSKKLHRALNFIITKPLIEIYSASFEHQNPPCAATMLKIVNYFSFYVILLELFESTQYFAKPEVLENLFLTNLN